MILLLYTSPVFSAMISANGGFMNLKTVTRAIQGLKSALFHESSDHLFMSSEHCSFKDGFKVLCANGDRILRYKNPDLLLDENRFLISKIRDLLDYHDYEFNLIFLPLIRQVARIVSVAPASESFHDSESGGLFTHSLMCAFKYLELSKATDAAISREDELMLVMAALTHDLGKMATDFKVMTPDEECVFDSPENVYLEDFCKKYNCPFYRFRFDEGRGNYHEIRWQPYFEALMSAYMKIKSSLSASESSKHIVLPSVSDVYSFVTEALTCDSKESYSLLKNADVFACALSLNGSHCSVSMFLKELLLNGRIDTSIEGFYKTSRGYIIEHNSPAFNAIVKAFDNYQLLLGKASSFYLMDLNKAFYSKNYLKKEEHSFNDYNDLLSSFFGEHSSLNDLTLTKDRDGIFNVLNGKGFFTTYCYKTKALWFALKKEGKITLVYGPCVELPLESSLHDNLMFCSDDIYEVISSDCRDYADKVIHDLDYEDNTLTHINLIKDFSLSDLNSCDHSSLVVENTGLTDMVQKGVREDQRTDRHYECEKARNTMLNDVRKRMGQKIKGIPGPDNDDMARLEDIV